MQVLVRLQAEAVNVNTWVLLQPDVVTVPALHDTLTGPHSLDAVGIPPNPPAAMASQFGSACGLQPNEGVWPQLANVGAVTTVHVNVFVQVDVRLQAVAVNVNI